MSSVADLRCRFDAERRLHAFDALPRIDEGGIFRLGRGTVLTLSGTRRPGMKPLGRAARDAWQWARVPTVLKHVRRAAVHWQRGDRALAHIELAFARLPRLADEDEAFRLFLAETALDGGACSDDLARTLGVMLGKYDADQPRVPAGSGRASGQWTSDDASGDGGTTGQQRRAWPKRRWLRFSPMRAPQRSAR